MPSDPWTRLLSKIDQINKIKQRLGVVGDPPLDEVYRPKGMKRRDFKVTKARLERLLNEVEALSPIEIDQRRKSK